MVRHSSRRDLGGCRPPPACSRPAAVRSPPPHREAGNRAERFIAASSFRAIRDVGISYAGAGRDGRRWTWVLLAAGAEEKQRGPISRRAEPDAGRAQAGDGQIYEPAKAGPHDPKARPTQAWTCNFDYGAGARKTSTSKRPLLVLRTPCGTPDGATSRSPAVIGSSRPSRRKWPEPSTTW